jgi:hypothetical protein
VSQLIRNRALVWFFSLQLPVVLFAIRPTLIEGVIYPKVILALISQTFFLCWLLLSVHHKSMLAIFKLVTIPILLMLGLVIKSKFDINEILGAPSRYNGYLSLFLALTFIINGVCLSRLEGKATVGKSFAISPIFLLLVIILQEISPVGPSSLKQFAFSTQVIHLNKDFVAVLISMGLVWAFYYLLDSSQISYLKWLSFVMLVIVFALLFGLIQIYFFLLLAIFLHFMIFRNKYSKYLFLLPLMMVLGFILSCLVIPRSILLKDASIEQRYEILKYGLKLLVNKPFSPIGIDHVSDYSLGFSNYEVLDDVHNVFLQHSLTLGIFFGIFSFFIFSLPFLFLKIQNLGKFSKVALISYSVFYLNLFIGILSPEFMYFGFLLYGVLLSEMKVFGTIRCSKRRFTFSSLFLVAITLISIPVYSDLIHRVEISRLTSEVAAGKLSAAIVTDELLVKIEQVGDAAYGMKVAQNFYNVGDCAAGDEIVSIMRARNPLEPRLYFLGLNSKSCRLEG